MQEYYRVTFVVRKPNGTLHREEESVVTTYPPREFIARRNRSTFYKPDGMVPRHILTSSQKLTEEEARMHEIDIRNTAMGI